MGGFPPCLLLGWGVWGVSPHAYLLAGGMGGFPPCLLTSRGVWGVSPHAYLLAGFFSCLNFPLPRFFAKFSVKNSAKF